MPKHIRSHRLHHTRSTALSTLGIAVIVAMAVTGCQNAPRPLVQMPAPLSVTITLLDSPVQSSLRGVHAVSQDVCWASGSQGVWLRTTDQGSSWLGHVVEGARDLDFRDVHAFDDENALLLTAGAPARVYVTRDAGQHWAIRHQDMREGVFFDAMAFWDDKRGIAFSDPVDGSFVIITTRDAGISWTPVHADLLPAARAGEAGFAASGTCLATAPNGNAWIGLGGDTDSGSRVLHTNDFGQSWSAQQTPIHSTESAGIFSLVFLDASIGIAVGGDYLEPDASGSNAATTRDGGATWTSADAAPPSGYRSVVAVVEAPGINALLAAGPNGVDLSTDEGRTWQRISDEGFHAMSFAPGSSIGYATGADGRLARIKLTR